MIYKLDQIYLTQSEKVGMNFICMSTTGLYFLASAESLPTEIEAINKYPDSSLAELYENPEWIQPSGDE